MFVALDALVVVIVFTPSREPDAGRGGGVEDSHTHQYR
jgi:hypothetical protein